MARSIVLSNGTLCVALDSKAEVRDIYFPHVGLEDHVRGHYLHRIGVWVDGRMSWFDEDSAWQIEVSCANDALVSAITAKHEGLEVELHFSDLVYNERPILIRRVSILNKANRIREIKLYFGHQFEIYKSHGSDTAYFDPIAHAIIHYKGQRVFLMSATLDGEPFGDFVCGRDNFQGKEGSHRDADDGKLSQNPIEHGPADSVIGLYASYAPGQSRMCYYRLLAATSIAEVHELDRVVTAKTPEHLIKTTTNFWHAWLSAPGRDLHALTAEEAILFKRSLMYVRAHVDHGGGILASVDSDMLQYGLDTYSYVWPRDASYAAIALDSAGDTGVAKKFFEFCCDTITDDGYFMHKYLPDKSLGSSWHPWVKDGRVQLPIQEDETALVLLALKAHYEASHDLEFLEDLFNPLVEKAANFLVSYRDAETKLPQPSYDLWERKRGISTYTASAVYGALLAAADLARVLGKDSHQMKYTAAAGEIRDAIIRHLWDEKLGVFINMLTREAGGKLAPDRTIDISSVYGVFAFGILLPDDERLVRGFENTVKALSFGIEAGGIARFENDDYYQVEGSSSGNPWIITTLWWAQYQIARAKNEKDLSRARDIFAWVAKHAQPSGILSEQLNPHSGEQIGATPLAWSHAAYVSTVLAYLEKRDEIGK